MVDIVDMMDMMDMIYNETDGLEGHGEHDGPNEHDGHYGHDGYGGHDGHDGLDVLNGSRYPRCLGFCSILLKQDVCMVEE